MTDRVVLITGATGILGREVARTFAADGARLALAGTNADRLAEVATDLGLGQDRWTPVVADLRDAAAVADAVRGIEAGLGPVDVLIHLVGGYEGGTPILELDPATVGAMLDQHVWTTLHVTRAVVPGMLERGWGRVLTVTTPVASEPPPKMVPYAIGKGAQEILLRTLARETADTGVTVNLVVVKAIDERGVRTTDPKKRSWTAPSEIAATFRWLASDDAAAVTGARVPLHGRG